MYPSVDFFMTLVILVAAGVAVLLSVPVLDALLGLLFRACSLEGPEGEAEERRPTPAQRGPAAAAGGRREKTLAY